ncbi:MAG: hypothetical protein EOM88_02065 [Clostridia bacterium]|nr:hypothetical protein [Clostridia bacterium]
MKNFDRGNKRNFGGSSSFEKRDFGGSRGFSERKEMFPAVCSECGNRCEVPFRPSGSKPVFCSECFRGHDTPAPRGGRNHSFSDQPRKFQDRSVSTGLVPAMKDNVEERLTAIHNKLDKIADILNSLQHSQVNHRVETSGLIKKEEAKPVRAKLERAKELKPEKKEFAKKEVLKKKTIKKNSNKAKTKSPAKKIAKK